MKKIVYSITKVGKEQQTITGVGYVTEKDLIIACASEKAKKPYVRVFENAVPVCHAYKDKEGTSYRGIHVELCEYQNQTYEVTYVIWYKEYVQKKA